MQKISNDFLEVKSISSGYGLTPVITNISFSLKCGDILGIYGANGSGKSTVLSALSGLCEVYKGQIIFSGDEVQNKSSWFRAKIGIRLLPQNWQIFPSLTVIENLAIPNYYPYGVANKNKLLMEIEVVLERTPNTFQYIWKEKISGKLFHPAGGLSGGERQILSIVRSLLGNGRILLLDEPLQSLSLEIKRSIEDLIIFLGNKSEKIIVVVEHDLHFIQRICTKSIILEQGNIISEEYH